MTANKQFSENRTRRENILMSYRVFFLTLLLSSLPTISWAEPLGTAFTYQGRLDQESRPAEGLFDFEARLFDAQEAGEQVGTTMSLEDVEVVEGLFVLSLDFGEVFATETGLWLELSVAAADVTPLELLLPRQPVRSTPLALRAATAESLGDLAPTDVLRSAGDTMSGDLQLSDASLMLTDGIHTGGELRSDPKGLTLSTPDTDRLLIQSKVGIGVEEPVDALEVAGGIKLGLTAELNAGTLRWTGDDFEGYDGTLWRSLTVGSDGAFVDLTSNQTVGGSKTFTGFSVFDRGLRSLDDLWIGAPGDGKSLRIYTFRDAVELLTEDGARVGELGINDDDEFLISAGSSGLRIGSDLYLQAQDGSRFRDLHVGEIELNDQLEFRDDGDLKGVFQTSGEDVLFFPGSSASNLEVRNGLTIGSSVDDQYLTFGSGSTSRIVFEEGPSSIRDLTVKMGSQSNGRFQISGSGRITRSLTVNEDLNLGRNVFFSNLPSGAASGSVCFEETFVGDVIIRCSSSARYKTDIETYTPGLDLVRQLRPVSYSWLKNGKADVGFIAEEVAELDPLLVVEVDGEVDGVKYDRLTTVLVNALQEQQEQIEALQKVICRDRPGSSFCS